MSTSSPRLSRRQLLAIGGGVASGLTLAACGTGSGGGGDDPTGGGSGSGGGTLELWANAAIAGDSDSGLQRAVLAWGEANGVTVNVQGIPTQDLVPKLTTTSSGGSGPDVAIVDVSSVPQLAAAQVLADVTDQASSVTGDFGDELLASSSYDGSLFGLPYTTNNVGLYYNRELLDGAGIAVPTTWDELREAAIELTGGDQYGYMMGAQGQGAFLFWPWLWQNGGTILSEDLTTATFADDLGQEAFAFYAGLAVGDKVAPPEFVGSNASWDQYVAPFVQGRCAMMAIGPWGTAPVVEGNPDLQWAVAPLPGGAEQASVLGGATISVGHNSGQSDLAWELVSWLTASDQMPYIQDTGNIPGRRDVIDSDWASEDPDRLVFVEQMEVSRARPALPVWGDIEWGVMANMWDAVIQGQQAPADALAAAAEETNQKLSS
ncbi:ABC transporter substrate-binding protein [Occultella kanbiaonis]|uniref:ABC transporter substrate-binding protein n=1 Tax=Occultella kanbiaonis TaxID=2675754 RepID=UPI0012B70435|nr:sugar ABC transporter substrate-binding protein [Occultella kanbiaonis]